MWIKVQIVTKTVTAYSELYFRLHSILHLNRCFFFIFVTRLINCDVLVSLQLPLAQIVNFANLLVSVFVVSELGISATAKYGLTDVKL